MIGEFLGYINHRLYSDVDSYKVFKTGDKFYAVEVKKEIGDTKPNYREGGFCAHCDNNREVFDDPTCKIVECGEPFEIFNRYGYWGYKGFACMVYPLNSVTKLLSDDLELVRTGKSDIVYELTSKGKRKTKFRKLGVEIEQVCRYYKDLNF